MQYERTGVPSQDRHDRSLVFQHAQPSQRRSPWPTSGNGRASRARCARGYYRLWGENSGDSGTGDTDFIDIPADAPDDMVDKAIREAAAKIEWRGEVPVIVGCYHDGSDQEEDDDLTDTGVWRPMTRDTHEQTSTESGEQGRGSRFAGRGFRRNR